jgi:hypothetical protein
MKFDMEPVESSVKVFVFTSVGTAIFNVTSQNCKPFVYNIIWFLTKEYIVDSVINLIPNTICSSVDKYRRRVEF